MSRKHIDVAELIGITTPQPCPKCQHPEHTSLLDQSEPSKVVAVYCRHCMWQRGGHALVREYVEHCGHHFGITCAACGRETCDSWINALGFGWNRIGWAWICPDHLGDIYKAALNELLDALAEGRLP